MIIRVVREIEFNGQGLKFTAEAEVADEKVADLNCTKIAQELFESTFKKHPVQRVEVAAK